MHKHSFSGGASGKEPPSNAVDIRDAASIPGSGRSPGVRHSNPFYILAWRIPCIEEPGGLQSIWSQNVRYNWNNLACIHTQCINIKHMRHRNYIVNMLVSVLWWIGPNIKKIIIYRKFIKLFPWDQHLWRKEGVGLDKGVVELQYGINIEESVKAFIFSLYS